MVWKDGRRKDTTCGGGSKIISAERRADRGVDQVTFDLVDPTADVWVYTEGERFDMTAKMIEAEREIEARRWAVIRRGLDMDDRDDDSWFTSMRRRLARWVRP